ncbi:hypothetical protein B0H15DRAFT_856651 [Mycena belliarum]|uniref:Uncharacterized protein n=1 Tax=Mycena belliarum TaxID=1033014 RepID=A0AAD6TWD4_9AGAR|nr:hypothetical protein B0H15DRAFT_856651 [Mycena belliae]
MSTSSACTAAAMRRAPRIFQSPSPLRCRQFATAAPPPRGQDKPPPRKKLEPSEFIELFRGLGHLEPHDKLRARPIHPLSKLTANVSPRIVFAEMLRTCFGAHPPAATDPAACAAQRAADARLLNVALRAFSRREDYAAALVVLRAFGAHGLPVTDRTYAAATDGITRRIAAEDLVGGQKSFAHTMLGVTLGSAPPTAAAEQRAQWVMKRLLTHDMPPRGLKKRGMPEGEMDVVPLSYVVRRAFCIHGALVGSKSREPWGDRARLAAETKAKVEMLPRKVALWTWKTKSPQVLYTVVGPVSASPKAAAPKATATKVKTKKQTV